MKPDFTDEDGITVAKLEDEFESLNGWEAESNAAILLSGLGLDNSYYDKNMKD